MERIQRHKCFISYHRDDQQEVDRFIETFDSQHKCFIYRAIREMDQNIIHSQDPDYVMRRIRELYLADSTVTIVLIGECTWTRRYVDWEIASTLRNDPNNKRSGLMAITLPSMANRRATLPPRLEDNCDGDKRYARLWTYPSGANSLETMIEDAFTARSTRADLINKKVRELFGYNRACEVEVRTIEFRPIRSGGRSMEPVTFILGLASSVLGNILTDLVTGKSRAARRNEIEQQVAHTLLVQSQQENRDLKHMLQQVMEEIEVLSRRDPDLKVTSDRIELRTPVKKHLLPFNKDQLIQDELTGRLKRLGYVIEQRRDELGLPTTSDRAEQMSSSLRTSEAEQLLPTGWEHKGEPKEDSKWGKAIKETDDRIRKRRAGEEPQK